MTNTAKLLHILILEDHPALARFLNEFVRDLGHYPEGPVDSMEKARDALARQSVDAAFLDVHVRDGLVFPLADELQARGVPFAFCTAYEDSSLFPDAYRDAPRLTKPFTKDSVRDVLQALLPGQPQPEP